MGNCLVTPQPKTNPHLGPNHNLNWAAIFLGGKLSGYQYFLTSTALLILIMKRLYVFRNWYWLFWSLKINTKISKLLFKIQTIVKSYHKQQELLAFLKILKLQLLQWILVRNIGQFWQKIELCLTKTVRCIWVKNFYITTLLLFCSAWDSFLSENILYFII